VTRRVSQHQLPLYSSAHLITLTNDGPNHEYWTLALRELEADRKLTLAGASLLVSVINSLDSRLLPMTRYDV
jgi:hypothetical protein